MEFCIRYVCERGGERRQKSVCVFFKVINTRTKSIV